MSNKHIYYVYAYLRSKNSRTARAGTPYYVGKGKHNRAFQTHRRGSKGITVPADKSNIVFLEIGLTEIGALALERRMIRWYGRKDANTGILLNLTDGGDGTSGAIRSEEYLRKLSARVKSPMTIETRIKIGNSGRGKINFTEDQKLEMSAKRRLNRWWHNDTTQCFCETPPDDSFILGRGKFNNIGAKLGAEVNKGRRWVNNSTSEMMIGKLDTIPEGFVLGRC